MMTETSRQLWSKTHAFIREAELNYFNAPKRSSELSNSLGFLMKQVLHLHPRSTIRILIERYLRKYPQDKLWERVFPIATYSAPNPLAEKLTTLWIRLNKNNPDLLLMGTPIICPSPEVIKASVNAVENQHSHIKKRSGSDIRTRKSLLD